MPLKLMKENNKYTKLPEKKRKTCEGKETSLINFHLNGQDSDFFCCGNALLELCLTSLYDFPNRRLKTVTGLRYIIL